VLARIDAILLDAVDAGTRAATDAAGESHGWFAWPDDIRMVLQHNAWPAARRERLYEAGILPRLDWLVEQAGLTPLEADLLLLAVLPELEPRYQRVFGFLQDDMTRRRPTVGLALTIVCRSREDYYQGYRRLVPGATLTELAFVHLLDDPDDHNAPFPSRFLAAERRIVTYLLGDDDLPPEIAGLARLDTTPDSLDQLLVPGELAEQLARLTKPVRSPQLCAFEGPPGVGKRSAAAMICRARGGQPLLVVDTGRMPPDGANFAAVLRTLRREALLQNAILFWDACDVLLDDEPGERRACVLQDALRHDLVFVSGQRAWYPALPPGLDYTRLVFPHFNRATRAALWERELGDEHGLTPEEIDELAGVLQLQAGQIHDAAALAQAQSRGAGPDRRRVAMRDLLAAGRAYSAPRLSALARRVVPRQDWNDLVLPDDKRAQLQELCSQAHHRARVYEDWGFEHTLAPSGLVALFAGPSGTGKTMAASVIARDLGLDLYAIDLSLVVSKYIGETEKHLAALFAEAETANAVLFFDEADALFGKRSDIHDAHDRYANQEVAYLLQRIEAYQGVVILASNLRKNIDDAFIRRMQFIVDFPLPGEAERRRIWHNLWPVDVPRDPDLDIDSIARRFDLAGGNIRNIALGATFLAAGNGGVVTMQHVLHAARREYQKIGKVVAERDFALNAERGTR
jgi:DNA polymerase III delta prime subunit